MRRRCDRECRETDQLEERRATRRKKAKNTSNKTNNIATGVLCFVTTATVVVATFAVVVVADVVVVIVSVTRVLLSGEHQEVLQCLCAFKCEWLVDLSGGFALMGARACVRSVQLVFHERLTQEQIPKSKPDLCFHCFDQ